MRQSLFIVAALAALLVVGCSPVAWSPRETPHTSSIDLGEQVALQLRDGSTVTGIYEAAQDLSQEVYGRYYHERSHESAEGALLPMIGQTVRYTTALDESRVWEGTLLGFDESSLLLSTSEQGVPERVYFSSLGSITSKDGKPIRRMVLRGMFLNGEIPLKSAIVIRSDSDRKQIPLNEIEKIGVAPPGGSAKAVAWLYPREVTWARN